MCMHLSTEQGSTTSVLGRKLKDLSADARGVSDLADVKAKMQQLDGSAVVCAGQWDQGQETHSHALAYGEELINVTGSHRGSNAPRPAQQLREPHPPAGDSCAPRRRQRNAAETHRSTPLWMRGARNLTAGTPSRPLSATGGQAHQC